MDGFYTVTTAKPRPQWEAGKPAINIPEGMTPLEAMKADALAIRKKTGHLHWDRRGKVGITSQKDEAIRDRARRWKATVQRLDVMHPHMKGPMTVAQISAASGLDIGATAGTIRALHKRNIVFKVGTTRNGAKNPTFLWSLAPNWSELIGRDE